jgi:hypothetical protein
MTEDVAVLYVQSQIKLTASMIRARRRYLVSRTPRLDR